MIMDIPVVTTGPGILSLAILAGVSTKLNLVARALGSYLRVKPNTSTVTVEVGGLTG